MNSNKKTAVMVAVLFLTSTVAAMIGSALIDSYFIDKNPDYSQLIIAVLFWDYCSVAVALIGVLMFPILKPHNKSLAVGYAFFRIIECAVIIIIGIYFLSSLIYIQNYYLLIYIPSGIAGLILSYGLYQSKLVPRSISVLGLIGYALLLCATMIEYIDPSLNANVLFIFLILYLPGTVFEILLPVWLIVKGFNSDAYS